MTKSSKRYLAQLYKHVNAKCPESRGQCEHVSTTSDDFVYIPGDIIIAGLFDVHEPGNTPYSCGKISRKRGLELSEAFLFAIEYISQRRGIFTNKLNGIDIGGLALDTCGQPTRSGNIVANIHNRNRILMKNNAIVPTNRIDVYVGPALTESTIRVADVLDVLSIPVISYQATSLYLQDQLKYRYFLRSVPADDKLVRAIISFLNYVKINYVQTVYDSYGTGERGHSQFLRLANLNDICVRQSHKIGVHNVSIHLQIANTLQSILNNPEARTLIIFVDDPLPILRAIDKNSKLAGKYFIIGTDKWGTNIDLSTAGLREVLKKAMTFDVETADVPEFDLYLDGKTVDTYTRNPWFKEYYEYVYNCSFTNINRLCDRSMLGISRAAKYLQDTHVLYVVNAVFSAALGIHNAISHQCPGYMFPCDNFLKSGEKRQMILEGIKSSKFTDATNQPFYYTTNGESGRGYHIYDIIHDTAANNFHYKNLGSYNDTHYLKLHHKYNLNWDSYCDEKTIPCKNCQFVSRQPSKFSLNASSQDINIIGIFDIHAKKGSFSCGDINSNTGFQHMLAFKYAINIINQNKYQNQRSYMKLGSLSLDTCSNTAGLGQNVYSLLSGESLCSDLEKGQLLSPNSVVAYITMGSSNSRVASDILSPYKITSFSPSATAADLSDQSRHSHFLRTVPPDIKQANVMIAVMKQFGFKSASVVFSSDNFGRNAKNQLLKIALNQCGSLCIVKSIEISSNMNSEQINSVVKDMQNILGSRVVILFTNDHDTRSILKAANDLNLIGYFIWFGSSRWGRNIEITKSLNEVATGAITIEMHSEHVAGFQTYLENLSLDNHDGLPKDWFEKFYQATYKCRITDSLYSREYPRICDGSEQHEKPTIRQDPHVLHTIISVHVVAEALQNIEACQSSTLSIASCLDLQPNKRDLIHNAIRSVQLNVLSDDLKERAFNFKLTPEGHGNIRYNIYNYYRNETVGDFVYDQMGYWQNDNLQISVEKYRSIFHGVSKTSLPSSDCALCKCENCPHLPDYVKAPITRGYDSYYITSRFLDAWGIIVVVLATLGVFLSICLLIYLVVVYPVRNVTSVLDYLLLLGVIIMFLMVYPFVLHASVAVCGIRRFGLNLSYCICFSCVLIKLLYALVECWKRRGVDQTSKIKNVKLGRPIALFIMVLLLILVQVLLNAEWLGFQPPATGEITDKEGVFWIRCLPNVDSYPTLQYDKGLTLSMIYVYILIVLSIILSVCTWRNANDSNKEVHWILLAILFTVPCLILWGVISCLMPIKYRDAAIAIGLLFNSYVLFVCIPVRKFYVNQKSYETQIIGDEIEKISYISQDQKKVPYEYM